MSQGLELTLRIILGIFVGAGALLIGISVTCWAAGILDALQRIADAVEALRYDKEEDEENG